MDYFHLHFIGIAGTGMSAVARILLDRGYKISGSDLRSTELTKNLEKLGAKIYSGHHPDNLQGADTVVYSTAIPQDNQELQEARKQKLSIKHRADLWAEIINYSTGITVAGAHGKTTTTSMLGYLLTEYGMDPTVLIGAFSQDLNGNARPGRSPYVVAEADESDNSFIKYFPYATVITNIDPDHLENFQGDFNKLVEAYRKFLKQVKPSGFSLLCQEDPLLQTMKTEAGSSALTYGFSENCDYQPRNISFCKMKSYFSLYFRGSFLTEIYLAVPGEHNILNATAALAVGHQLGLNMNDSAKIMEGFQGAKRRFQVIGSSSNITVVDDYAHHPTEIKKTLQTAKLQNNKRMVVFFQPKRYTRTKFLFEEFTKAFADADVLVISEIFPFGEEPIPGITSENLALGIEEKNGKEVKVLPYEHSLIVEEMLDILQPGDLALIMGAGDDIAELAWKIYQEINQQTPETSLS